MRTGVSRRTIPVELPGNSRGSDYTHESLLICFAVARQRAWVPFGCVKELGEKEKVQRRTPMLILSRRPRQSLKIGDHVIVTVLAVRRGQVRIGIEAPKNVPVHRNEIYTRIQASSKPRGGAQMSLAAAEP